MTRADLTVRNAEGRRPGGNLGETRNPETGRREVGEGFERFVTKLTVAERLEVEIRTVSRLMRRGVLRYYKLGTMVRFKWSEVERDLEEHFHVGAED